MAKHRPSFVRCPTALIASLAIFALPPCLAAIAQDFPQSLVPPTDPFIQPNTMADARLEAVESQVQQLLAAKEQRKADAASAPTFKLGGQIQIDYLFFVQNAANRATIGDAEDTFDFRRARLTGRGDAFEVIEYAVGFDFALTGHPAFLDNYIEIQELPLVGNFRVGHYFEPFSLERFTQNRYNTFMERSLADTFAPARNLGMMIHDTMGPEQRGTWAAGWFRSFSGVFGDDSSDTGGWAVTSRATWLPYYHDDGRTLMHVGAGYTYRSADDREVGFLSFPEARAGDPVSADIPAFVDTGTISALSDQRTGVEFAVVHGPVYLQAEYICTSVDQIGGPPLFFQGAYGFISYFLTGESRTYNRQLGTFDRVYPFENFFRVGTDEGIETGSGAWEVAFRWSFIDLDSHNIRGGTLNDLTLGLNWYLNPYTRFRWEYIYARLDRVPVGPSSANIAGMRFDIDF